MWPLLVARLLLPTLLPERDPVQCSYGACVHEERQWQLLSQGQPNGEAPGACWALIVLFLVTPGHKTVCFSTP